MKRLTDQIANLINADRKTTAPRTEKVVKIKRALDNPMQTLKDDERYICEKEEEFFGVSLTYSVADTVDINTRYDCGNVLKEAPSKKNVVIVGQVSRWNETKVKNGKNGGKDMCFITIEDSTGRLDDVCFSDAYNSDVKAHLYSGSIILIDGRVSEDRRSFIVDKVKQAE